MMRRACRLVVDAHHLVREMLKPGVSTGEIDAAVERHFAEHAATPLFKGYPGEVPFPAVICISINEEVVHGIPGERTLRDGDIVSIDTGCRIGGWCGDAAWSYPVGNIDPVKRELLAVGEAVLELAVREVGRCSYWSEVAAKMEDLVERAGFAMVEEFVGHGIGREMHEDPQVPSFVDLDADDEDFLLQPGLVLAIEPMVVAQSNEVVLLDDHWTVETADRHPGVHFEHTVALTDEGPLVLTEGAGAAVAC